MLGRLPILLTVGTPVLGSMLKPRIASIVWRSGCACCSATATRRSASGVGCGPIEPPRDTPPCVVMNGFGAAGAGAGAGAAALGAGLSVLGTLAAGAPDETSVTALVPVTGAACAAAA